MNRIFTLLGLLILAGTLLSPVLAQERKPAVIETMAGTGKSTDGGAGGPALETNIGNPFGVEFGPDGALYICEVSNHRVRRMDNKTGELTTVAGTGKRGYAGDGGLATEAQLNEPYEVRFDEEGNMFFVEMKNHLVRRVDGKTGVISTLAGTGQPGFGGDGGPAQKAQFQHPHSIALDRENNLYIADIGNHRIRRVNLSTATVDSIAGDGSRELPKNGQTIRDRPILGPRALTVTGSRLWIALRQGHSVWRLDLKSGVLYHIAGTGRQGYSGDGGPSVNATFNGPKGIAVGPDGNVYVVDTENQVIRKLDLTTKTISTVAGRGPNARGGAGDGGLATRVQLNRPHGICLGQDGSIYIGDSENHRVRRVRWPK